MVSIYADLLFNWNFGLVFRKCVCLNGKDADKTFTEKEKIQTGHFHIFIPKRVPICTVNEVLTK